MERTVRERMTTQERDLITPQTLINIRPVVAAIKEFPSEPPSSWIRTTLSRLHAPPFGFGPRGSARQAPAWKSVTFTPRTTAGYVP